MSNHPQGTFDLMFALKGGINLSNYKSDSFNLNRIFVMAQQEGFFNIQLEPTSQIYGIVFYAESFAKLFNFPLKELTNKGVNVADELSQPYLQLYENLLMHNNDLSRISLLDKFLLTELSKVDFSFSHFDRLIQNIRGGNGQNNVSDLVDSSNLSERTLQRRMNEQLGITPKSFLKVVRFKEVLKLIDSNHQLDWQDILYECGYFDQAHFIKDFKIFTGKTPTQFLKDTNNLSKLFLDK
jgi:AraC-like DNA-binding protein